MKKTIKQKSEPTMLKEYDFSKGVRGKYATRYAHGANIVVLEPDVSKYFKDSKSVNNALRALTKIIRSRSKRAKAG
jgi:hypothetical protein